MPKLAKRLGADVLHAAFNLRQARYGFGLDGNGAVSTRIPVTHLVTACRERLEFEKRGGERRVQGGQHVFLHGHCEHEGADRSRLQDMRSAGVLSDPA